MTHSVVLQIVGRAGPGRTEPSEHGGKFLRDFDPDAYGGRGRVSTTPDPARAQRFATPGAALECWRLQSRSHPLRPDGEPNRPLTAYTCQIVPVVDAVASAKAPG